MIISQEEHHLWAKVAKLYYEDDLTQDEIAKKLGYSRVKIHRILQSAKKSGIIQFHIKVLDTECLELEHKLIKHFDLRDCVVVETKPPGEELYLALARGTAAWIKPHLLPRTRVGLGLGRTLSYLPQVFRVEKSINCTFTEIAGAVSDHNWGYNGNNIASQMAEICHGNAEVFYAPTIVSSRELRDQLIQEQSISKYLERARNCDLILQSVGPVDESAILFKHGYLSKKDLDQLLVAGAVGDALGCYFDKNGGVIPSSIEDRMIGMHLSELVGRPWSILVAGGNEKILPIYASLKGRYFNVLITDTYTGQALLKQE
jgi:DNA-binding transcriptional regulator LsrR (DeoR family)